MKRLSLFIACLLVLCISAEAENVILLNRVKRTVGADVTAPQFSSATINGTALVVNWTEACTRGGSYNDTQLDLDMSTTGANIGVTYQSGDGTAQWTYAAASAAVNGETVDLDFDGTANSIEDGASNDLAALVSSSVTNNTPPAGIAWTFECLFEGTVVTTTYTAGGGDVGFSSGTLSAEGLVDTTNDLVTLDADDENILITRTDSIFQSDQGAFEYQFTWTDTTSTDSDFQIFDVNTDNYYRFRILGDGRVRADHRGQGSLNTVVSTVYLVSGQRARVRVKYYATGNNTTDVLSIAVDNNDDGVYDSWTDTADTDAVTTWASEITNYAIGDAYSGAAGIAEQITFNYVKWVHDYTVFD